MKRLEAAGGSMSKRFGGREMFLERLSDSGCSISTNPHHIEAREQSLKDTWSMFFKNTCCAEGIMPDGRRLRDQSSGNFPRYFPLTRMERLTRAMREAVEGSGAYMGGIENARSSVAGYYMVPPDHVFFTAGISDGIDMVHQLFLNNTKGRVLIPNESYPTHFATAIKFGGRKLIEVVGRDQRTGIPDLSGPDNPFLRVGFSSFIPYDNPNPIAYPESFFRNDQGTGVFDRNEAAFLSDGVIRPIVLDMIYQSFSWPEAHIRIRRLVELSEDRNILIFLNSASKVFLEPNKRAGVVAVYVPPALSGFAEGNIIRDLQSLFDMRLCGISNVSVAALVAAHEMLAEDERAPLPELEALREEARRRFIGDDGKGGNEALMRSLPHVSPLHPDLRIESSGYNLFAIDHPDPPWMRPAFKESVLARLRETIAGISDPQRSARALSAFDTYMRYVSPADAAPSDIFCLDLVMSTGVAFAPIERFYKLGTAPSRIAFRPVMVAEQAAFAADASLVGRFLDERL